MQLIMRLWRWLSPTSAELTDLKDRVDTLEWRLTCLEDRAAQEAFAQEYGKSHPCGVADLRMIRNDRYQ